MTTAPTHRVESSSEPVNPPSLKTVVWLVLLTTASYLASLALACITPFAAFGALAALHLRPAEAVALMIMLWATNQVVGFALLHYPHAANTYIWGVVLLAAALAGAAGARAVQRLTRMPAANAVLALAAALLAYEGVVFLGGLVLGGNAYSFTAAVLFKIVWTNTATLVAITLLYRLALAVGLARRPAEAAIHALPAAGTCPSV